MEIDIEKLKKSAEQSDAEAQFKLGRSYDLGNGVKQDWKQAVYWFTKAAEQGNAQSQNNLGVCYFYGEGVEQDSAKAIH